VADGLPLIRVERGDLVPSFVQPAVNPGEPLVAPIHPKRRSLPITSCPTGKVMTS
jgi:hypothetical protein